jgi:hypothetical protein
MKVNEFIKLVKESYYKEFPKSKIQVALNTNLYSSIGIKCILANNESEVTNGIIENDMLHIRMSVARENSHLGKITQDDLLPDDLLLEVYHKYYMVKPENKFHAFGSINLPFRKTKGNSKKLAQTLEKYFKKLKESLKDSLEKDLIHDNHKNLVIEKIK